MKSFLYLSVFLMAINNTFSQNNKYEKWPLQDNSKEVEASFGESTPSTILHDAIDIYGAGKNVVPARKWAKFKQLIAIHF